jgi:hypothetical protein
MRYGEDFVTAREKVSAPDRAADAKQARRLSMKRYSIIVGPHGANVETETVICQVDENPEGVAQVIRARHRYESVRVVENIERGELGNTQ